MVSILHRYVLRELVRSFLFAFFTLLLIMLLGGMIKPLKMGLSLGQILRFLPYILPYSLPWVVPAALLTSSLMTYGRLAADNELTATAAGGLPVRYMCYPAFVLALLFSLAEMPINGRLIPYCRAEQRRVIAAALAERPFALGMLGGQETIEIGDFRLLVGSIDDDLLHGVLVIAPVQEQETPPEGPKTAPPEKPQKPDKGAPPAKSEKPGKAERAPGGGKPEPAAPHRMQLYRAQEARYSMDTEKKAIRIEFKDARYTIVTPDESASGWLDLKADEQTITIPVQDTSQRIRTARNDLYNDEIRPQIAEDRKALAGHALDPAARRGVAAHLNQMLTEIHRREALSFTSLVLCLVGVPLGIWIRRESKLASFGIGVVVFLMHQSLLIGAEAVAMNQKLSPLLVMWAPDALIGLLGIVLLLRTFRR
jgi:lipopolysaccharide export LptBFGC system permease protein LptF